MDATQIVLIVFIVILLVAYPVMMYSRNKKENQRMQEQTNSLKRGDKVLTTSGVYGTIIDLHQDGDKKIITIETGSEKNKGYISVDAFAIYTIFREDEAREENVHQQQKTEEVKLEENSDNKKAEESEKVAQVEDVESESSETTKNSKKKGKKE